MEKVAKGDTLPIKVVSQAVCVNTPRTIERIEKVAAGLSVKIAMEKVVVATMAEAEEHRFQASPTVIVNGLDIAPNMRTPARYGFS